jgi:tyrosyl-DNA phosphodiesterase 2
MKIVTQNLWFDSHQRQARMEGHVAQWQACDADIVAVQEATLACLRPLLDHPWLKSNLWSSASIESDASWQGVVVFSKVPPQKVWLTSLPGSMGRRLLNVQFNSLHLGVVHLESTSGAGPVRAQQLSTVFAQLSTSPDALLVGDFNFCSTSSENDQLPADYLDLWPHLHPGETGWTHDTGINTMMLKQFRKEKFARYDRMLLRSGSWRPIAIDRLGLDPLAPGLFASDHFGLCAHLKN